MKLSGDIWGKTRTAVTMAMPADRARGRSRSDPSTCSTRGRQPLRERRNSRAIIATNDRLGGARSRARHATEAADRACEPRPPRQGSHRPSAGHEASARRRGVALEASRVCTADAAYRHCRRERWRWLRWICVIETPARRCLNAWRFWSAVMWAKPIGRREGRARLPRLAARVYNPSCQIGKKKATPALFF
jgi:hypothetical protein